MLDLSSLTERDQLIADDERESCLIPEFGFTIYEYLAILEFWSKLPKECLLSKYEVSSLGNLRCIDGRSNQYQAVNTPNTYGYVRNGITNDEGNRIIWTRHRLVALAFIPNPEELPFVDHVNRTRHDNRLCNLRWSSISDNVANSERKLDRRRAVMQLTKDGKEIKLWASGQEAAKALNISKSGIKDACRGINITTGGFKWQYYEIKIEGEKWKSVNVFGTIVKVSDHGRVRLQSGKVVYGYSQSDYMFVGIAGKTIPVHRLVCVAFHGKQPKDKPTVNHKDHNPSNNHYTNLEWASQLEQNLHKRPRSKGGNTFRPIIVIGRESGKTLFYYNSMQEAMEKSTVHRATILKYIQGTLIHPWFIWRYANSADKPIEKIET